MHKQLSTSDCSSSVLCCFFISFDRQTYARMRRVLLEIPWISYAQLIAFKVWQRINMWRSIGKGVLNKTIDVKVQALLCLNFDVNRFVKYSFSYGTSHILKRSYLESCFQANNIAGDHIELISCKNKRKRLHYSSLE